MVEGIEMPQGTGTYVQRQDTVAPGWREIVNPETGLPESWQNPQTGEITAQPPMVPRYIYRDASGNWYQSENPPDAQGNPTAGAVQDIDRTNYAPEESWLQSLKAPASAFAQMAALAYAGANFGNGGLSYTAADGAGAAPGTLTSYVTPIEGAAGSAGTAGGTGLTLSGGGGSGLTLPAAGATSTSIGGGALGSGLNASGVSNFGGSFVNGGLGSTAANAGLQYTIKDLLGNGSGSLVAGLAGPIIGSALSSKAIRDAAGQQSDATNAAIAAQKAQAALSLDEIRRQYDLTRADLAPWRDAGAGAVNSLSTMLGTNGNTTDPTYGSLNKKFTLADFWDDPVTKASYQSGLDLGTKGINNMAAAKGGLNSGATLKALTRFGTDYTGNQAAGSQARFVGDQTNTYNRLAGVAGLGQTAANSTVNAGTNASNNIVNTGTNTANTVSGLLSNQGNARGAASIAAGNNFANAGNTISSFLSQQQLLDRLLQSRGGY